MANKQYTVPIGSSAGTGAGGGVTSFTGDGTLINNVGSTGAVTDTLANAAANTVWGNATTASAAPGYTTNPVVTSVTAGVANSINGTLSLASNGSASLLNMTWTGTTLNFVGSGNTILSCTGGMTLSGSGGATLALANGSAWTTGNGGQINMSGTSGNASMNLANSTAATVGQAQSVQLQWVGKYWTGAASAADSWTIQNAIGNGTNGTSTLTISHSAGTTGLASIALNAHCVSTNTDFRSSVSSASGTTVSVTYAVAYGSQPFVVVTPTTNAGAFFLSAQATTGFTITYATSGAQTFNYIVIG